MFLTQHYIARVKHEARVQVKQLLQWSEGEGTPL